MIIGVKELEKQLESIDKLSLRKGIARAAACVQAAAKANCPVHDGELRGSIYTDTEDQGDIVRGVCYTDKNYSPFVEFGTGPKGRTTKGSPQRLRCPIRSLRGGSMKTKLMRRLQKSTTSSISTRQKAVSINVPDRLHSHSSIRL